MNESKADPDPRGAALAARMKIARDASGLTQEDLEARTGIKQGTISKYECGEIAQPSAEKIIALARALGVDFEWLATGAGEMAREAKPGAAA